MSINISGMLILFKFALLLFILFYMHYNITFAVKTN